MTDRIDEFPNEEPTMFRFVWPAAFAATACLLAAAPSFAQADTAASAPSRFDAAIANRAPELRLQIVDRERLAVRRLDIVDERGVIRMTLGAPTPGPIIDGIEYRRAFPVAGLIVFDKDGSERGGFGVADVEGTAVVAAQDHINGDAIGWRVMPDGAVSFQINERSPVRREAELGGRIAPGSSGASRIRLAVAADGTPAINLADRQNRPRLRLSITPEGFGAIEFLDAQGRVVDSLAPERSKRRAK